MQLVHQELYILRFRPTIPDQRMKVEHRHVFIIYGSHPANFGTRLRSLEAVAMSMSIQRHLLLPPLSIALSPLRQRHAERFIVFLDRDYIQRHSFPLAVPAATQSFVGWNCATAGTAVIPPPPSCASCSPFDVWISTKRFMFPMQNRCTPSEGCSCHWARSLFASASATAMNRGRRGGERVGHTL